MKKRLLKILTLVLLTWPTPWLHAQETSYTIQDFEGEYSYQSRPYSDLVGPDGFPSFDLKITGKIVKIIQDESHAYRFIIEDNKESQQYFVNWNSDPNIDIAEGDNVYIRGTYMGIEMEYNTNQEYPYILVNSTSDTVEKVE